MINKFNLTLNYKEYDSINNLKKLVRLICASHPYIPNLKELLAKMNMQDNYMGLYRFLEYLRRVKVFNVIRAKTKGDFIVDDKYTFEIGGKNKKFNKIKDIENSYIVSDDMEIGSGNKIPLWLFGFLY